MPRHALHLSRDIRIMEATLDKIDAALRKKYGIEEEQELNVVEDEDWD